MLTFFLAASPKIHLKKKTKKNKKERTRRGNICMTINNKMNTFRVPLKKELERVKI